ncbi:DUF3188 domain-containing protein [Enterococcus sp. JM9B]|nr:MULTISPECIES: DUF3188 domain-containing protein [Enterococcus]KAF1304866.1 DUF3188 domain-containing protein [Enterococcus sp. JM9B]
MERNGLFLCSIGFLIILFSMKPGNMQLDVLSLATGVALVALGAYIFFKGKKKSEGQNGGKQG